MSPKTFASYISLRPSFLMCLDKAALVDRQSVLLTSCVSVSVYLSSCQWCVVVFAARYICTFSGSFRGSFSKQTDLVYCSVYAPSRPSSLSFGGVGNIHCLLSGMLFGCLRFCCSIGNNVIACVRAEYVNNDFYVPMYAFCPSALRCASSLSRKSLRGIRKNVLGVGEAWR